MNRSLRTSPRVTVCLPALDEEATVGSICASIRNALMPSVVDELLVVDSGSSDATVAVAEAAGARVHRVDEIAPLVERGGKGEALWKSLAVANGDLVVWIDSDIRNFDPAFVTRLIAPFTSSRDVVMSKAYYRRPLVTADASSVAEGGGRVTELGLRPLLNLLAPELSGIVQPLSGEYALRTEVARDLPFFSGYGVDVGLLLDVAGRYGVTAIRQVDLGTRIHDNRSIARLGQTSFEVMAALLRRVAGRGDLTLHRPLGETFRQFGPDHGPVVTRPDVRELPPRRSVGSPAALLLRDRSSA